MIHILLYNHYIVTVFNTEDKNTQTYVGLWQKHKETKKTDKRTYAVIENNTGFQA